MMECQVKKEFERNTRRNAGSPEFYGRARQEMENCNHLLYLLLLKTIFRCIARCGASTKCLSKELKGTGSK